MYLGIISVRYAKALYQYALLTNAEDKVYREMLTLKESYSKIPQLAQTINNPVLQPSIKEKLLQEAAGDDVSNELKRFISLVLEQKRESVFLFMINSYCDIYRKKKNICTAKLITAYSVAEEVVERIRKIVVDTTKGELELVNSVDSNIEGGFIFEIGTYRLDVSVASQLRRIKSQFVEKNRRIV